MTVPVPERSSNQSTLSTCSFRNSLCSISDVAESKGDETRLRQMQGSKVCRDASTESQHCKLVRVKVSVVEESRRMNGCKRDTVEIYRAVVVVVVMRLRLRLNLGRGEDEVAEKEKEREKTGGDPTTLNFSLSPARLEVSPCQWAANRAGLAERACDAG